MSSSKTKIRRMIGLGLVLLAYAAGVVGWTWAVLTVEPPSAPPDSTRVHLEPSHAPPSESLFPGQRSVGASKPAGPWFSVHLDVSSRAR